MILIQDGKGTAEIGSRTLLALAGSEAGACSLLDLGSGDPYHTRKLACAPKSYVDCKPICPEPGFIQADLFEFTSSQPDRSYDLVVALDVVEHFNRGDGLKLVAEMERLAKFRVVIFTPLGPLAVTDAPGPDSHKSGWFPKEFSEWGYSVWAWPEFHHWDTGTTFGAFWAWKTISGPELAPEDVRLQVEQIP